MPGESSSSNSSSVSTSDPSAATAAPNAEPWRVRFFRLWTETHWSDVILQWVDVRRRWLLGLLALIYLVGFNPIWRLEPDSALYLSLGRSIATGNGYVYHGKSHRLAYPGTPVLFAGVYKLAGYRSLVPHIVTMMVVGLATLALFYRLILLVENRATAVFLTLGLGMTRLFYRYSFELLSDMPFLFGVMMFLCGYEGVFHRRNHAKVDGESTKPRWFDWLFLLLGLAITVSTRPSMWAMVFAAAGAMGWNAIRGRLSWRQILAVAVIGGAVALFYLRDPRHSAPKDQPSSTVYLLEEQMLQFDIRHLGRMLSEVKNNLRPVLARPGQMTEAVFGTTLSAPINLTINGVMLILGLGLLRKRPLWGMFILATVGMILLVPKPQERYFLPIFPLLVFAWWSALRRLNHSDFLPRKWSNLTFLFLLGLGAVPNGAGAFGFLIDQRTPKFLLSYKNGRFASAKDAAEMIRKHTPPSGHPNAPTTTWILTPPKFARVTTFLSERYATEPDRGTRVYPERAEAWKSIFVLEPSDPEPRERVEGHATVREWLAKRGFEIDPTVIASTPNKDPRAISPWELHPIRPIPPAPTTAPSARAGPP